MTSPERREPLAAIAVGLLILLGTGAWQAEAQSTPAAALLAQSGWEAIRSGRIHDAADAFRRAMKDDPRDASLRLGAGLAAHLLGQPAEARHALDEALRLNPRLTDAALLLGEIAYREGDRHGAIRTFEEALALTAEHGQMQERLARWRREAALPDAFDRRISDHFTILFEGPAEQPLADQGLQILEAAYWRVAPTLGIHPIEPIAVILYTEEQFRDITRAPAWAAGAFDGTIRVPVRDALAQPREVQRVLTHELTHALIWSIAPRPVPKWLDEGLAVVFEGENLHQTGGGPPSIAQPLPLASLHGSFGAVTKGQAAAAYAQSGLAVQALLDLIGGAGIANLLTDLAGGAEFGSAFASRASLSYADFQARWPELARPAPGSERQSGFPAAADAGRERA